jgi:hypothetical protein
MALIESHYDTPDTGVRFSDLFIYDSAMPGTGALVSVVNPGRLDQIKTTLVETNFMRVVMILNRDANTAEVILSRRGNVRSADRQQFRMTPEFLTETKVSLTLLFSDWKIVALVDGEPLDKLWASAG